MELVVAIARTVRPSRCRRSNHFFLRYWAAFKILEHFACTHPEHRVHLWLTPRLVTLRVHTGQWYFVAGPGF